MASSAHQAARAWFDAVVSGDAREAWRLVEPAYRQWFAEGWAGHAVDEAAREETVRAMSEEGRDDALWSEFAEIMRRAFAESWPSEAEDSWEWMERTHHVDRDCEYVRRVDLSTVPTIESDEDGTVKVAEDAAVEAIEIYMRRDASGEWLLAGLNEFPPDWLELDHE